jgi:hypothetical protein
MRVHYSFTHICVDGFTHLIKIFGGKVRRGARWKKGWRLSGYPGKGEFRAMHLDISCTWSPLGPCSVADLDSVGLGWAFLTSSQVGLTLMVHGPHLLLQRTDNLCDIFGCEWVLRKDRKISVCKKSSFFLGWGGMAPFPPSLPSWQYWGWAELSPFVFVFEIGSQANFIKLPLNFLSPLSGWDYRHVLPYLTCNYFSGWLLNRV